MSSLLFGSGRFEPVTEGLDQIPTGYVDGTRANMNDIILESTKELFELNGGYYISDVIMTEAAVMEGAQAAEPLLENFVKGAWDKLKKVFTTLWAKVKAWFVKAKDSLKLVFVSGEKFVKQFKQQIYSKDASGFEYTAYPYDLGAGATAIESKFKTINSFLSKTVNFNLDEASRETSAVNKPDGHSGAYGQDEQIRAHAPASGTKFKEEDVKKELRRQLGKEDWTETLKDIKKAFRGGKDSEDTIKTLNKDHMTSFISDAEKGIKEMQKEARALDEQFSAVLKSIDRAKAEIVSSKESEAEKARLTTYATHKYNVAHYGLTLMQGLSALTVDMTREIAKSYERTLKAFLRFKPTKESFGGDEDYRSSNGESILESAARFL